MKNNKLKKIIVVATMCVAMFSTVVYAIDSTGGFTFGTFAAQGTLDVDWNFTVNDTADALTTRTSAGDSTYRVVSYLEAQDDSSGADESQFDKGELWAAASITREGVWRFNSTHGISRADSVYVYKAYRTLSDW